MRKSKANAFLNELKKRYNSDEDFIYSERESSRKTATRFILDYLIYYPHPSSKKYSPYDMEDHYDNLAEAILSYLPQGLTNTLPGNSVFAMNQRFSLDAIDYSREFLNNLKDHFPSTQKEQWFLAEALLFSNPPPTGETAVFTRDILMFLYTRWLVFPEQIENMISVCINIRDEMSRTPFNENSFYTPNFQISDMIIILKHFYKAGYLSSPKGSELYREVNLTYLDVFDIDAFGLLE